MSSDLFAEYAFGEVVIAPFPFTNQTAMKKRPAVVISSPEYNRFRPDLLIMPVTSQLKASANFGEVCIEEWKAANLLKPSAVKPHIATIEKSLIIRRLGYLQAKDVRNYAMPSMPH